MATAEIYITLKPTLLDAQGATVTKALRQLGHEHVRNVRIGKYITVDVDDMLTGSALQAQLELMCQQLLANPVIEDYSISLGPETGTGATPGSPAGVATTPLSPLAAAAEPSATASVASAQGTATPTVLTTDVVPQPQQQRSDASLAPDVMPAQVTAPHLSAPQPIAPGAAAPTLADATTATPTQVSLSTPSAVPSAAVLTPESAPLPDPFAVEFRVYDAMTTDEKLALQNKAWQEHGAWIMERLNEHRAAWILCVGHQVVESGATLESYPSDDRLASLGDSNNLVPWVFTRPPT